MKSTRLKAGVLTLHMEINNAKTIVEGCYFSKHGKTDVAHQK
jgi:Tfp pilus assembly major pilin PilA